MNRNSKQDIISLGHFWYHTLDSPVLNSLSGLAPFPRLQPGGRSHAPLMDTGLDTDLDVGAVDASPGSPASEMGGCM